MTLDWLCHDIVTVYSVMKPSQSMRDLGRLL